VTAKLPLTMQVLLNSAKEAPAAFLPHLQPLVAKVQQLWDQVRWSCVINAFMVAGWLGA